MSVCSYINLSNPFKEKEKTFQRQRPSQAQDVDAYPWCQEPWKQELLQSEPAHLIPQLWHQDGYKSKQAQSNIFQDTHPDSSNKIFWGFLKCIWKIMYRVP